MCFYKGIQTNVNLNVTLGEAAIDLSGFQPFFTELETGFDFPPSVVVTSEKGITAAKTMEWGLVPAYIKDSEALLKMRKGYMDASDKFHPPMDCLNARVENMFDNLYKDAAMERHCVIPVTHFFEWRHIPRMNKKNGKPLKTTDKFPYVIQLKEQQIFWIAGIWQGWTDRLTGEYVETYSVITQPANELMKKIHNSKERMPAILNNRQAYDFLMSAGSQEETLEILSERYPSEKMKAYTIHKDFRTGNEPLAPVLYAEVESAGNEAVQNGRLF